MRIIMETLITKEAPSFTADAVLPNGELKTISLSDYRDNKYVVLLNDSIALRGTFLIDKKGVVRHATLNDLPLGRNVDETLRLVDALQHAETHGEVCPAGWTKGQEAMTPNAAGVAKYLTAHG